MLAGERARRAHTRKDADAARPRVIDVDAFAGPRSSRTCLSPGTVAGAPAVDAGTPDHRRRGDRRPGRLLPGARGRVRRRDARGGRPLRVFLRLDTFGAGAA